MRITCKFQYPCAKCRVDFKSGVDYIVKSNYGVEKNEWAHHKCALETLVDLDLVPPEVLNIDHQWS